MNLFRQYARQLEELTKVLAEQQERARTAQGDGLSRAKGVPGDQTSRHFAAPTRRQATAPDLLSPVGNPVMPHGLPVIGRISSRFGMRFHPILERRRAHNGEDIAARAGTPVWATADGVVTTAGSRGSYGTLVEIDHGNGVVTRYAHLGSVTVAPGQRVRGGTTIGTVGQTGAATGPHLHYEVMRNGRFEDPSQYLRARTTPAGNQSGGRE